MTFVILYACFLVGGLEVDSVALVPMSSFSCALGGGALPSSSGGPGSVAVVAIAPLHCLPWQRPLVMVAPPALLAPWLFVVRDSVQTGMLQ